MQCPFRNRSWSNGVRHVLHYMWSVHVLRRWIVSHRKCKAPNPLLWCSHRHSLTWWMQNADSISVWIGSSYWISKSIGFLCTKEQMEGNGLFRDRHNPRLYQVAYHWNLSRIIWFFESVRVRQAYEHQCIRDPRCLITLKIRDFFPVILSFLRRLPIIGPFLNHPIFTKVMPKTKEDIATI